KPPSDIRHAAIGAIAIAATLANLALNVNWVLALVAGEAVLLFGELAGRLPRRSDPRVATPTLYPEPPLPKAYPLTKKELEVARMVAQGMTNREIATKLFNSERTIDNHVQHIYNKLGIDSRAELALGLRDHELLPEPVSRNEP